MFTFKDMAAKVVDAMLHPPSAPVQHLWWVLQ
jgi:hypothetical protein